MSLLIVNDSPTAQLAAANDPIELCAPDGRLLGYFTPVKERIYQLEPPASDAELEAIFAAGGGRPLADILQDLEKRS